MKSYQYKNKTKKFAQGTWLYISRNTKKVQI